MGKKVFRRSISAVVALIVCLVFSGGALAADWVVRGDDTGLYANPVNPDEGSELFNVIGMVPGDSASSTVTVRNDASFPFVLTVQVVNLSGEDDDGVDLAQELIIEVSRNGTHIDSFPETAGTYEFAEPFYPGDVTAIDFTVSLPRLTGNEFQNRSAVLQWIFTAVGEDDNGGGGGGSIPGSVTPEESIDIDDESVPAGEAEPQDEDEAAGGADDVADVADEVTIEDEQVALAEYVMPKTGELSLVGTSLVGSALILLGIALLIKERNLTRYLKQIIK